MNQPTRVVLGASGLLCVVLGILGAVSGEATTEVGHIFGFPFLILLAGVWLLGRAAGGNRTAAGAAVNIVGILGVWLLSFTQDVDTALYLCTPLAGFALGVVMISAVLWHYPGDTPRETAAGRRAFALGVLLVIGSLIGGAWVFLSLG